MRPVSEEQTPDRPKANEPKTSQPAQGGGGAADNKGADQKKSSKLPRIIGLLVLVIAIGVGVYYYISTRNLESTDDAYTDGRAVTIAPHVSGYVVALLVNDNQRVKAGQVLARIDQRDFIIARDQAAANLVQVQARERAAQFGTAIARKNFPARLLQAQGQLDQDEGPAVPGADGLQAAAFGRAGGDDAAERGPVHRRAAAGARQRDGDGGRGAGGRAGAGKYRPDGPAGQRVARRGQAGPGATGAGRVEPELHQHRGAAGRLDHQAQHRGGGTTCRRGPRSSRS